MAIYHLSIKNIGRSSGQSAVASSAYRAGEKLHSIEDDKIHNYEHKSGVVHSEIMLPSHAPNSYQDRATLWNEVQKVETASDARLAREFEIALPVELSFERQLELAREYAKSLVDEGMCVDFSIHDKGDGNPHIHMMTTTRPIKENGEWGAKEKKAYALDENGERIPIIDKKTGEQKVNSRNAKQWKRETVQANDWNKREKVEEWRERWAGMANKHLEELTPEALIDHRSYKRQGIEQIPTIHEGYASRAIVERGKPSRRASYNQEVRAENAILQEAKDDRSTLKDAIDRLTALKADLRAFIRGVRKAIAEHINTAIDPNVGIKSVVSELEGAKINQSEAQEAYNSQLAAYRILDTKYNHYAREITQAEKAKENIDFIRNHRGIFQSKENKELRGHARIRLQRYFSEKIAPAEVQKLDTLPSNGFLKSLETWIDKRIDEKGNQMSEVALPRSKAREALEKAENRLTLAKERVQKLDPSTLRGKIEYYQKETKQSRKSPEKSKERDR